MVPQRHAVLAGGQAQSVQRREAHEHRSRSGQGRGREARRGGAVDAQHPHRLGRRYRRPDFDDAVAAAQKAGKTYYFGGHTIFRQGLRQIQIQGVEFAELGQGGKLGHYPVHFHKTQQVPPLTFVKDSSVNDSNTHWYVIHGAQGVTLQRNVGWKSIGQGYYLEDGTDENEFSPISGYLLAQASTTRARVRA